MIRQNVPFAEYLSIPAVSAHGLMLMARSMAHYRHAMESPREPTQAQALGTHVHGLILEPESYRYAVIPDCDRRTKAGKDEYAAFLASSDDAHVVTADQHRLAMAMREAVMSQPYARALLADGMAEVTLQWEIDGLACKARADFIPSGHDVLIDVKTASDASWDEFSRAAGRYRYAIQAEWYRRGAAANDLGPRPMIFVVVENEPPHAVALYQIDDESIQQSAYRIDRLLEQYRAATESGVWSGYPIEIQTLTIPRWAL